MKICYTCKLEKSLTEFAKKKRNKDGFQSECKQCRQAYQQKWYQNNIVSHKAKVAKRNKKVVDELREFVNTYKMNHPCVNCGFGHPAALQFHHVKDKKMEIALMVIGKYSQESIMKEIEKCIVLCANCHAIHHYEERIFLGV